MTVTELAKLLAALDAAGHGKDKVEVVEHDENSGDYRFDVASVVLGDGYVAFESIEPPEL